METVTITQMKNIVILLSFLGSRPHEVAVNTINITLSMMHSTNIVIICPHLQHDSTC